MEDEIHNIQAVIDSISMDLLHEDLSHLTGESMVFGAERKGHKKSKRADLVSIEYLLDIIRSLNEWISSRLESNREDDHTINNSNINAYASLPSNLSQQQEQEQNQRQTPPPPLATSVESKLTNAFKANGLGEKSQNSSRNSLDLHEKVRFSYKNISNFEINQKIQARTMFLIFCD